MSQVGQPQRLRLPVDRNREHLLITPFVGIRPFLLTRLTRAML